GGGTGRATPSGNGGQPEVSGPFVVRRGEISCGWVRCKNTPPQLLPCHLSKVGIKRIDRNRSPASWSGFSSASSFCGLMNGAPNTSNGVVVPRPSERLVPSSSTWPG